MKERYRPPSTMEYPKTEEEVPKKIRGRPFLPGNSGRPPGSKNRTTRLIEALVAGEAEKVTRKFIDLALAGNVKCIQFYLDRLLPRRNGRPVDVPLPEINNMHDVVKAMAAITTAVNDGDLTAEEAGQLMHLLEGYTKVYMAHDFTTRLETLESQMRKTP